MVLQKKQLETFFLALKGTESVLTLAEARLRDGFMKILSEATQTFIDDRTKIYEKFANKDKEGKADVSDGNYHFENSLIPQVNKELEILGDEKVTLKPVPATLKSILEKTEYKPKVGEAEIIDDIISKL